MITIRRIALLAVALLVPATLLSAAPPAGADQNESVVRRVAAASIAAGEEHTCVLLTTGRVRCWGYGFDGALGYGNNHTIGDNEAPASAGNVSLGGRATAITAGASHTCALLTTGRVRCWGYGGDGRLGYGNTDTIGDGETPASAGNVTLGGTAVAIAAGGLHTCALLSTGKVRCWGFGGQGRLGYGNTNDIGDGETPASAGNVPLGGTATAITAGGDHTCALLTTGKVRCWGDGEYGQLGHGNTDDIGDGETPASAGNVTLGGTATAITVGERYSCALLGTGRVRCWGYGSAGQLGYGNTDDIGDGETPASAGNVTLGGTATAITAGDDHTCALLTAGRVRCWGWGNDGALGYGNLEKIGDTETPASAGDVPFGGAAVTITAGGFHTCALLGTGRLRCWGHGGSGQLGNGGTDNIGDNETPDTTGNIQVGAKVRVRAATATTVSVRPRRDRRAPYVYVASGRVKGRFVADDATCGGKVQVLAKKGTRTLASKRTRLRDDCTYRAKLRISGAALHTKQAVRLKIKATYRGTPNLARSGKTTRVRAN